MQPGCEVRQKGCEQTPFTFCARCERVVCASCCVLGRERLVCRECELKLRPCVPAPVAYSAVTQNPGIWRSGESSNNGA